MKTSNFLDKKIQFLLILLTILEKFHQTVKLIETQNLSLLLTRLNSRVPYPKLQNVLDFLLDTVYFDGQIVVVVES